MILLDPDLASELDPHSTPASRLGKAAAVRLLLARPRNLRLPSARTLAGFLGLAQAAVRLKGRVTVLLTTDTVIRRLNREFRGKNKPTDVLSFPADGSFPGSGADKIAGDLAISVPTALRQAMEQGHALSIEIKVLILHGLLHLAGYDHEADTGRMARRELLLRARLGAPSFPWLHAERVGNHDPRPSYECPRSRFWDLGNHDLQPAPAGASVHDHLSHRNGHFVGCRRVAGLLHHPRVLRVRENTHPRDSGESGCLGGAD